MQADPDVEQLESYLFKERDEVLESIDSLLPVHESDAHLATCSTPSKDPENALNTIRTIVDKYLECPTLLDPSLQCMVEKLVSQVKQQLKAFHTDGEYYHLQNQLIRYPLTALYTIAKVRGYKRVNAILSHQVEDVDLIWNALVSWKQDQNVTTKNSWEPLYILWHWMGVLSLVPFHSQVMSGEQGLMDKITSSAKIELEQSTGPVQEAAATCLASWLSRPDVDIFVFTSWSVGIVQDYVNSDRAGNNVSLTLILGVLQVLTKILKHSSATRQSLIERLVEPLWEPLLVLASDPRSNGNLLLHRYLVKWWTRSSCAYFPPTRSFAPWRYQRGQRMLLMDQRPQETTAGPQKHTAAAANLKETQTTTTTNENLVLPNDDNDDLFFVPDQVEDAMGRILESLGHSSTIVRWSAAKGVGRLTERLPALCALDVLDAVLEYFENPEKDNCWHGACLALAELARKGLLLPVSLPEVVHEVIKAIHYDVKRGHSSVGSNVRDAACYVFWAFARSYSPQVLRAHLDKLAEAVILVSLFDREVNCRRAASAAFQEAVGRQGMASFPNGIFVVTSADFFSLGNRAEAYTTIATKIAQLEEYRRPIIEHLFQTKLFHWDPAIRQLSAQGLASVTPLDHGLIGENALPFLLSKSLDSKNLHIRHGAVLGVAEILRVLGAECGALESSVSEQTMTKTLDLVNQIEKRRLYRGRGGEIMRVAVCRLVQCISLSGIPLDVKTQVQMLDAVDASIPHPNEEIQQCACSALEQLLKVYFPVGEKGPTDRLRTRVLEKFLQMVSKNRNPAATRGYALAVGYLPARLLAPTSLSLDKSIKVLSAASNPKAKVDGEGDAETRRNAITSIGRIVNTVVRSTMMSREPKKYPVEPFTEGQCSVVVKSILLSLEDYNVDRRGDVGSWCRIAAMEALTSLVLLCNDLSVDAKPLFAALDGTKLVGKLTKQLAERLDAVRLRAGSCLQQILLENRSSFPAIIGKTELTTALELKDGLIDYTWAEPKSVFRRVMAAALVNEGLDEEKDGNGDLILYPYYDYAIAGIVASVGGKAEATEATHALLTHAKEVRGTTTLTRLGDALVILFERHKGVGRVTLPLLRSLEKLLSRRCLDELFVNDCHFASSLQKCIESEIVGCRDITRLLASADVSAALISALERESPHKRVSLLFLCKLLEHSYPKLRSHVAETVYMAIEENRDMLSTENDAVITLLLETSWGSDLTREEVRQSAADVQKSLGLLDEPQCVPTATGPTNS